MVSEESDHRLTRGRAVSAELFGDRHTPHLDSVAGLAPDLVRYAVEFVFGDVYARPGLSLRDRELVTIGALTAIGGAERQLAAHLGAALNVGLSPAEVTEALIHTAPFAGFPRSLNGVMVLDTVLRTADAEPDPDRAVTSGPVGIYQVDTFTDRPFRGNPAAVCMVDSLDDDRWMQAVAAEMNVSETAFIAPGADGAFAIRWFTPRTEVTQCGHATVAAAHLMWEQSWAPAGKEICFSSPSGPLVATRLDGTVWLDFPAEQAMEVTDVPADLVDAFGVQPVWVGRNRFDYLVRVADEDTLRRLRPDRIRLAELPRGVAVTARADSTDHDYVCRFFAPAVGVDEDPVTGSAQCSLGPYWSAELGATTLRCRQLSARPGDIQVRVVGDRVHFGGPAVTVLHGTIDGGR